MPALWTPLGLLCLVLGAVQGVAAVALLAQAAAWVHLLLQRRRPALAPRAPLAGDDLPRLLLQLPLYNEEAVVAGLLRSVAALDWPRDRLTIQVLDDSTDGTPDLVDGLLPELRAAGLGVQHVRRSDRAGFKAGALAHGLTLHDAPLVAILDADFRPRPDWLRRAVAHLDPDVGLVQCRWSFANADRGLLTRAQALHLDAHFAVEQAGRSRGGLFFGFNGTAGVWRRSAIEAAGGWQGDTLTEDLDLSYRAQLAGVTLVYADHLDVPCELPGSLAAVRGQQHRWIRGGAQVARKLLGRAVREAPDRRRAAQAVLHLLASSLFLPVLAVCATAPLGVALQHLAPEAASVALSPAAAVLRPVLLVFVAGYLVACRAREPSLPAALWRLLRDLPVFLALVTAICAHNARAAWLGWTGPTGTFVRTPKGAGPRLPSRWPETLGAEMLLGVCWWGAAGWAAAHGDAVAALLLGLQALGFSALVAWTLRERWGPRRPAAAAAPSA